jgi:hypothetical protein
VRKIPLPDEVFDAGDGAEPRLLCRRVAAEANLRLDVLRALAGLVEGDVAQPAELNLVAAPGAGQAAKICNNMIPGVSMIAVSEAFVLGEKLGLAHQALDDVISTSSGQCWSVTSYCPVPGPVPTSPANNGYKPGFADALMLKDRRLAKEAAEMVNVDTVLGQLAEAMYARFEETGHAGLDFSAIIQAIRAQSGGNHEHRAKLHHTLLK